jgi:AraC family transcriptional regulator
VSGQKGFFTLQKAKVFLWRGRALYIGMGIASTLHQHHALQIGISFGAPFRIRCHAKDDYTSYSSFIAMPNQPHEIDALGTPAAFLWLEGESAMAYSIRQGFRGTQCIQQLPLQLVAKLLPVLHAISKDAPECHDVAVIFHILAGANGNSEWIKPPIDPRVIKMTDLIKQGIASESDFLIQQMAEKLYLSPSRLRHLFQQQIGLSMQRYILWQRLLNALQSIASGDSLTQAAHRAGFADSAHLTRTYRMMFGHTPSEIFKNSRFVQAVICES